MKKLFTKFVPSEHETNFIVDTAEKAYCLGFLWGDGNLYQSASCKGGNVYYIRLEIINEDLEKIYNLFQSFDVWTYQKRQRKNRKLQGIICSYNKLFGWFLKEHDYDKKSHIEPVKILSKIPEDLKCYWWRGFIDADGCFYVSKNANQFCLSGQKNYAWSQVEKLFVDLAINKYTIKNRIHKLKKSTKHSNSSFIRITNRKSIIQLGKFIYSDRLDIGLSRKYKKYLLIKDQE